MSSPLEAVVAEAMKLSPEDRAEPIEPLADTVLPASPLHPSWGVEVARRMADLQAGRTRLIDCDDAMTQLTAHIQSRRPTA